MPICVGNIGPILESIDGIHPKFQCRCIRGKSLVSASQPTATDLGVAETLDKFCGVFAMKALFTKCLLGEFDETLDIRPKTLGQPMPSVLFGEIVEIVTHERVFPPGVGSFHEPA